MIKPLNKTIKRQDHGFDSQGKQ